jgi:predicted acyltransferase
LGLFLSGFPFFDISSMRIPGVLQRIAVCYFFAAVVFLNFNVKRQAAWAGGLMLIYWAAMQWFPVPGVGAGSYEKGANFSAWVDSLFLQGHMWSQTKTWDPEGIFSTLPAISTTLFGVLTGHLLQLGIPAMKKVWLMLAGGGFAIAIGSAWHIWLPINKNLWTSSYALFMSGMALVVLGISYYLIDIKGWRTGVKPFCVYGMNAITVFVLSGIVGRVLYLVKWPSGEDIITLKEWLVNTLFLPWLSPLNASLAYAMCFVFLSYLAMYYLYKKQIFIKI